MPSLIISNFKGIDRKSSSIDLPTDVATQLRNFSLTKRPGSISKSGTYRDAADNLFGDNLPSSVTFKNLTELSLTLPENRDIYLIHAQDGSGKHQLYVGKYWDGSAFQNGFLKITEAEGPYTADAGTNGNQIVDSELSSSVDDYYNGWIVEINIAAAGISTAAVVTDYNGATKTLTLRTGAITGATTGDTYRISRWPLKTGAIPNVDDKIRFAGRENAVIGMTGNAYQYPTQFNLWYGYVNRTYGKSGTTLTKNNFYLDLQPLLKPFVTKTPAPGYGSVLRAVEVPFTPIADEDVTYVLHLAYVYDDFQIGPLSESYTMTVKENSFLDITITIPIETCYVSGDGLFYQAYANSAGDIPTDYSPYLISRRVTAVRLYVVLPDTTSPVFWKEYKIADALTDNNNIDFVSSTQMVLQITENSWQIGLSYGATYIEDVGQNPVDIKPNFKYGVALDEHFIGAGIRTKTGDRKNNHLIASVVDGAGVATPDNFGGSNVINLGFFGCREITGVHVIGDTATAASPKRRLAVFTDDDVYILTLTTGETFSFALDRVGQKEGVVAPDSIVAAEGLLFGVSRNGFRVFTEQGSRIIGEGLKDDFDALTNPAECVAAYHKEQRIILWCFPTDQKYFYTNLLTESLEMGEFFFSDLISILLGARTGKLYGMSNSQIFEFESGNDQNGKSIIPLWRSTKLTARSFFDESTGFQGSQDDFVLPLSGYIRYKSVGSGITLKLYRNGEQVESSFAPTLPEQATAQSRRFKFGLGLWCKDLSLEATLSDDQAADNTALEIDQIKILAEIKKRLD